MMNLPTSWEISPLEKVVDILDNQRIPVNAKDREKRTGQVPYYGATGQVGWIDDYLFNEELVLLGEDGAPFLEATKQKAYTIKGKSWVNNHAHVLRARNGIPNAYIKYYLDIFDYHGYVTGTTRHKLNQAAMRQIPIPIAPDAQQKLIVSEIEKQFSRLDEAVAALKRIKANLKRYKASVLKAAVEGNLTEEWRKQNPNIEPAEKLLKRILAERKRKWEEKNPGKKYKEPAAPDTSDLPELPERWVWATVEQVSNNVQYGSSSKTSDNQKGIPVLRMGNIVDGKLTFNNLKYLPKSHPEFPELLLIKGDVLFNRTNSPELVGKTAVYHGHPEPCSFASYLIRVQVNPSLMPELISYYINSSYGRNWIKSVVSQQVGQANVNGTKLQALAIPIPSLEEQSKIVEEVESSLSVAEEIEASIETNIKRAERLRQAILKKAFEGRLI